jgi:N-acetylglucosamine kinase-like BadF-type ATPase
MTRRPALLAVDGGGSKIDAALLRRDGTLLGAARIPTTDHEENGGAQHMRQVVDAVTRACVGTGVDTAFPVAV